MSDIVRIMNMKPNFYALQGATAMEIEGAEQLLGTRFSKEYRDYVSAFGVASFAGHELTGVCKPKRLNVVEVTIEQRSQNPDALCDWYVVEEANIDGIVIWQAPSGSIYQTLPGTNAKKICNSLEEYILDKK